MNLESSEHVHFHFTKYHDREVPRVPIKGALITHPNSLQIGVSMRHHVKHRRVKTTIRLSCISTVADNVSKTRAATDNVY